MVVLLGRDLWFLIKGLLAATWLGILMTLIFTPVPNERVHLDLPLTISNQDFWVVASDGAFSGGPAYMAHKNSTPDFVHSSSDGQAICKFTEMTKLECGWVKDTVFHRAYIDLNQLLPPSNIHYSWLRDGDEYFASRERPVVMYIFFSLVFGAMIWAIRQFGNIY